MPKRIAVLFLFLSTFLLSQAQLKSPEEFLGYKVGTRYTPHWKIVNYFNYVASNSAVTMKLQQYGETNEGRPLLLAFISSPANIQRLEEIRANNIRLASLSKDKVAAIEDNAPAIVWLSYNVHGNEASSSEAALLTLYALTDPTNTQTKEWLKNTVVVIDPCINPDGRDRYVNWFNSIAGKNYNPDPTAREHREPWPGGRINHYNFDLNRDWAWQTQIETQQRLKVYTQWLPQIHVDFHEQGINSPYYFAPAAEPFHEVITPWQRQFQKSVGKNNAKYFDANGWLYYTKEEFDLFYPSYGDTYPIYNGSIGMTYEQAGHGTSGLGILNDEGDTLTLVDRALHHFTSSISTIEVASQNATTLVKEFRKYFSDAISNGAGEFKSYVIKMDPKNHERTDKLIELFDRNGIQYSTGSGQGRGYNFANGKDETFNFTTSDIVVSALQPKSALVKVLLEPKSKLVDSLTYDISAWSLPYVYGLNAYASREKITTSGVVVAGTKITNAETSYGYVMPWKGVNTVKIAGQLLQKGILLRYAERPFELNGNTFEPGTIIILKTANKSFGKDIWATVRQIADAGNVQLYPVSSGFVDKGFDFGSERVHPFKAPKVVLVTGEGISATAAGEIWYFFEREINYPVTLVNANDLQRLSWDDVDVLIMPDGNYRFLNDKTNADNLKNWIRKGGKIVALQNAVSQLAAAEFGIKQKKSDDDAVKSKKDSLYSALKKFSDRDRDPISETTPGAIFKVNLDNTHPLAFGYPDYYYTLKNDDNVYEFIKEDGWNVGVIKKDNQVAGFVGAKLKSKLQDGLIFGVQEMGNGNIVYLADDLLFRDFWENGKLMFCNAIFLVGK